MELSQSNGGDVEAGHGNGGGGGDTTHAHTSTKQDDGKGSSSNNKPATKSEWILRLGLTGNAALQAFNILNAARGGRWDSLSTSDQVARGLIYTSSGIGVLHSPIVLYKERKLTKEDTFRAALNGIREEQARLAEQNEILSNEVDDLQNEVDRMKEVETALRELSATQGTQLSELMNLIKKNKEINDCMRSVLKAKCLEEVVTLVLDMDVDGSFNIEAKEIDRLIIGMKMIEGISFDAVKFRQEVIDCDGYVEKVIPLIKGMLCAGGCETKCKIEVEDSELWFKKQKKKKRSPGLSM
ncbi:hypothetical protein ACHAXH_006268 [Discostella pseudostelligera]